MLVSSARVYLASFLSVSYFSFSYFFFNDTATTEIYTLSLHDALPISRARHRGVRARPLSPRAATDSDVAPHERGALGERRIRHVSDPAGSRRGPDTRARTGPRHGDRVGGMGFWDRGRCGPSRFHHRSLVLPSRLRRGRNSGNHGPDDVSRHGAPGT